MGNLRGLGLHLIFVCSFLFAGATYTICFGDENTSLTVCFEKERLALLKFKDSVEDPYGMLSSWVGIECCFWEGIHCDCVTQKVESLHLEGDYYWGEGYNYLVIYDLNSSLAELRHLKHLDLSGNDFHGSRIPEFIGSFKHLTYLNLFGVGFGSIIPHHIENLSNLKLLDQSSNYQLMADDMAWISGLSSLEHLDFGSVDLGRAQNRGMLFYMIPSLKELCLSDCGLSNGDLGPFLNSSRLLPNIKHLDLGFNSFQVCPGTTLSNIQHLVLSGNSTEGIFPSVFTNMTSLRFLDLSGNMLNSLVPDMPNLLDLYISFNQLTGPIPTFLANLSKLDLSSNQLNGSIPESFGNLAPLTYLDLSSNRLNRTIPISIGQLAKLDFLNFSYNSLEGVVSEAHFANLSMLKYLDTSSNIQLTFNFSREWIPPVQLVSLDLSSCKIANGFPQWLQNQMKLGRLVLSNATISGPLPKWLRKMPIILHLDLSHNQLIGPIKNLPNGATYGGYVDAPSLFLGNNFFNESIPRSLCSRTYLVNLDLSRNMLTRKSPKCLKNLRGLNIMILSSNRLFGFILGSIALSSLGWLKLNNNNFVGEHPPKFGNSQRLNILDMGDNKLSGHGHIPEASLINFLDIAHNNLKGHIPRCQGENTGRANCAKDVGGLHLSNNHLSGGIPHNIRNMMKLESLDLSGNELTGMIPQSMADLTFLSHLNLSHNKLSGQIPTVNQLQMLTDPSIYTGNKDLCGSPLPNNCSITKDPTRTKKVWLLYVDIICGFATGFWGVIGLLLFNKQWRQKHFMFAEKTMDKIYIAVVVIVAKMNRGIEAS
ncbi:hypothetical protein Lser_V15G41211 [Lactuca serriola]